MTEAQHSAETHSQFATNSSPAGGDIASLIWKLDQMLCRVLPALPVLLLIGVTVSFILLALTLYVLMEFNFSVVAAGLLGVWFFWTLTLSAVLLWYAGCPGHNRLWVTVTAIMSVLAFTVLLFVSWIALDLLRQYFF